MRLSAPGPVKNQSNMARSLLARLVGGKALAEGVGPRNNNPFFQAPGYTTRFWDQRTLGLEALTLSTLSEKFFIFSNTEA